MLNLCFRTDKPQSEIYLYDDEIKIADIKWEAHRKLADTIHIKIDGALKLANKNLSDVNRIIVYKGPGSFTGLRIGISTANAIAYSLNIPIVATQGADWIKVGINIEIDKFIPVAPEYGSDPHITIQKK